jgi:hypothetical protein
MKVASSFKSLFLHQLLINYTLPGTIGYMASHNSIAVNGELQNTRNQTVVAYNKSTQ